MQSGPISGEPPPSSEGPRGPEQPTHLKVPKKSFDHRKVEERKAKKEGAKKTPASQTEVIGPGGRKERETRLERMLKEEKIEWAVQEKGPRDERDQKGKPLQEEVEALKAGGVLRGPAEQPLIAVKATKKRTPRLHTQPATPQMVEVNAPVVVTSQVDTSSLGVGVTSNVDKIIEVLQNNRFFNGSVEQIQVGTRGVEVVITASLSNGVQVQINLAPGGQELNIVIQGLSSTAQAQIDNRENQQQLMERLAERGFVVHQIQSFRGEGVPAAAPIAPPLVTVGASGSEQREGRQGRGDREGQGDQQRGQQEKRR